MRILVINGPNMNLLGKREPKLYGGDTYRDLIVLCEKTARELGAECVCFQNNHEGDIVDAIQQAPDNAIDGIVINAAAYSHSSIAILDALKAMGIPAIEVHVTDPELREEFRHTDIVALGCIKTIKGKGIAGYKEAIEELAKGLKDK